MEHPLFFLCYLLQLLGIPSGPRYYEEAHQWGIMAYIFAPHMVHSYFVCLLLIILIKVGLSKREFIPKGGQNFWEFVVESLYNFTRESVPHGDKPGEINLVPYVFPLIVMFAVYILFSNYLGLIPGFMCPTANINVTLGLTLITIVYYHFLGIRFQGFKYLKQFLGPIKWLAPLMLFIEFFSHLGRIISLSVRLFANMLAKELIIGILLMLAGPFLAPLPILALGMLVAFVQMLIFITLSLVYFAGAVEEHH